MIKYQSVGIKAVAACVPSKVERNVDLDFIDTDTKAKIITGIGIEERRVVDYDTCSSDLCFRAAEKLLEDNSIDKSSLNGLIFVSQTSDYKQPATAPLLQHRLGLSKDTLCFDINLACSGYVYGLSVAFALCKQQGIDRILLLDGETMSKIVSRHDKENTPLFGDAGTATLIEKDNDFGESIFSMHSDGSGGEVMMIKNGGCRYPSSEDSLKIKVDSDGNERSGEQFVMDGIEVFNFGMREEPKDIKNLLKEASLSIDDIDVLVYHQANKFMTDFFSQRLKIDKSKTPYSLKKFGNTSSASIPLTIVSEMPSGYDKRSKVVLSGFGAGLSWGSCLLSLDKCKISSLIEY